MLSQQKVAEFSASLRGRTVQAGDADYDTSRKVYNAMIDGHNGGGLGICDEGLVSAATVAPSSSDIRRE